MIEPGTEQHGAMTLDLAYIRCEEITKREAKNFFYGIRLLPTEKRRAMSALYAMSRRIDDIVDSDDPVPLKLEALSVQRSRLNSLGSDPTDPVEVGLAHVAQNWPIPMSAFDDLVDGCEMDALGEAYKTFEDLETYCRRVAGSVGRLSVAVFGAEGDDIPAIADALGVAMQITNVLRDVMEDRDTYGRVYIPSEDLERFGCGQDLTGPEGALRELILFEAARARVYFAEGLKLLPMLDRRSRACVAAMAGIYKKLLDRIEADPLSVLRERVSLGKRQKLRVAVRSLASGALGRPAKRAATSLPRADMSASSAYKSAETVDLGLSAEDATSAFQFADPEGLEVIPTEEPALAPSLPEAANR